MLRCIKYHICLIEIINDFAAHRVFTMSADWPQTGQSEQFPPESNILFFSFLTKPSEGPRRINIKQVPLKTGDI